MIKQGDKFKDCKTGNSYRVNAVNRDEMILEVETGPNQVVHSRDGLESFIGTLAAAEPRIVTPLCTDSLNESIPQAADGIGRPQGT